MPIAVILIALSFLLQTMGILTPMFVAYAWPILLIIAFLPKLGMCKCCNRS